MNPVAIAFALSVPAAFIAGVYFSKSVWADAAALKQHVSEELLTIRKDVAGVPGDVASLLGKAAKKV